MQLRPYPATQAFEAPLTEVLFATLKPDASKEELEEAVSAWIKTAPEVANESFGALLEDERKYVAVNGWESLEKVIILYLLVSSSPYSLSGLRYKK